MSSIPKRCKAVRKATDTGKHTNTFPKREINEIVYLYEIWERK